MECHEGVAAVQPGHGGGRDAQRRGVTFAIMTDAEKLEKLTEAVEDLAQGLAEVHFDAAGQSAGDSVDPREVRVRHRAEAALKLVREIRAAT